jgi:TonB family protein
MSSAFHPNPFDLLGQTEMYVYPVHLGGSMQPKLEIAWNSFHSNFLSGIPVFFRRTRLNKAAPPSQVFPEVTMERRFPFQAIVAAALLHLAFFMLPWADFAVTPPSNHTFDNTQLVWSGPINDLPLLQIPKNKSKSVPKSETAQAASAAPDEAFHPRQRIYTDPVHPTHPRQTLINPAAPQEAPKFLGEMPNVVQLATSQGPARPRLELSERTLAKLRPKTVKHLASTDTPTPEISNLQQQTASLSISNSETGPAKPKLQINPAAAPRLAERSESGDNSAAPDVPLAPSTSSASSTLIAISAAPGPPAPVAPVPQGNLAARVAISPEGKPGASGTTASGSAVAGSGGSGDGSTGAGSGNSSIGVSISGGNPKPGANVSGLGAPGKFSVPRAESALKRPDSNSSIEDPAERSGPPNFAILPPGAKPEQIFSMKHVYSMNVNMPNLNSSTGSWIIHFSELHLAGAAHRAADVTSPVPIHKVDPKYPQELALEHVEGEVILYGVIRRDGTVDSIQKVRGIDEQLDANSVEAFAQWKFQPATHDGEAVDVEAIVHIPFKAPERR